MSKKPSVQAEYHAKKDRLEITIAAQYASALGKTANCQTLVSLTLARDEVPLLGDVKPADKTAS
jgi:SRSO17 transposase